MRLRTFLQRHDEASLEAIAEYWHIGLPAGKAGDGGRHESMVEVLAQRMPKSAVLQDAFSRPDWPSGRRRRS